MANPNIVDVADIRGESLGFNLSNNVAAVLLTVENEKLMKINRIICANVDGSSAASLSLYVAKANFSPEVCANFDTSGSFYIAKTISVPPNSTLIILDTPIYLMEADALRGGASAASDLDLFISYEVLNDA